MALASYTIDAATRDQRNKQNQLRSKTGVSNSYFVDKGGNTPSSARIGDVSYTGGGAYKIVSPDTPGAKYNPETGYYSTKATDEETTNLNPEVGGGVTSNDYYQRVLDDQQAAIRQRIDSAVSANNAYIPQVNQRSDQSLQNAYILREQNLVNAPQALAAIGYNGGPTETSLMKIKTDYGNTRNEVEQNRANSLNEIYQNEQQIRATGDATLAEASANYYQNLIAKQQAAEAAARDQANWQAEYDQENQQFESSYRLQQKEYEDAAKQQAWQNAYDERLLGLKQQSASKSSSSGGGDNTIDQKPSGYYSVVLNNVKRALGGSNAGSSMSWDAAINYIQNSVKQKMITEYEAQQLINQLGLS